MTHLRRHQAKLVFLGRVSLTTRGTTVNVWPRQRSLSSLTETMSLIQETLWQATLPCANLMGRMACLQPFSVETPRGNVVFIINNPVEWMLPRKTASCLSSVTTLCLLLWNVHLMWWDNSTVLTLSLKHLYVFSLQRADHPGMSGRGRETSKDLALLPEDEQVISKATENPVIQQQEPKQILRELQILRTLLSKPVAVILQVGWLLLCCTSLTSTNTQVTVSTFLLTCIKTLTHLLKDQS